MRRAKRITERIFDNQDRENEILFLTEIARAIVEIVINDLEHRQTKERREEDTVYGN